MLALLITGDLLAVWQYRSLFSLSVVKKLFPGTAVGVLVGAVLLVVDRPTWTALLPGDTAPETASVALTVTVAGKALRPIVGAAMVKLFETPNTAVLPWSRTRSV